MSSGERTIMMMLFSAVKLEWMACAAALRSEVVHRAFEYCSVGFILFIVAGGFIGLPITPSLLPSVVAWANCKLHKESPCENSFWPIEKTLRKGLHHALLLCNSPQTKGPWVL